MSILNAKINKRPSGVTINNNRIIIYIDNKFMVINELYIKSNNIDIKNFFNTIHNIIYDNNTDCIVKNYCINFYFKLKMKQQDNSNILEDNNDNFYRNNIDDTMLETITNNEQHLFDEFYESQYIDTINVLPLLTKIYFFNNLENQNINIIYGKSLFIKCEFLRHCNFTNNRC
jgi:hypothetical protein